MSEPPGGSVRATIVRNTAFNALGRSWEGVLGLILTPYILTHLDYDAWGLWSLVAVFTGYGALIDFGVASGFVRYLAQHAARGDNRAISAVVSTGFFFYLGFGLVIVAAGWPAVDFLMDVVIPWFRPGTAALLAKESSRLADMRFLFHGALVLFAVNNCLAPFAAVPAGLQCMGVSNIIGVGASIAKFAATVCFLELGYGVRGLLYANAAVLVLLAIATVGVAFRLCPGLRLGPRQVHRAVFRDLFNFGWRTQAAKLANLINFQTGRLVIAWFCGFALAGVYRIGEELAMKTRQLPALLVSAIIPAASNLEARDRHALLQELYLRATKYIAVVSVPLAGFLCAAADMAVRAWLGDRPNLDMAAWVLRILVAGHLVNLVAGGGVHVALGMGRPDFAMKASLLSMSANIVLVLALVLRFGFFGVPVGTSLALGIATLWFFFAMRRAVDVSLPRLAREALMWPMVACLPGLGLTFAIAWFARDASGRLPNLVAGGAAGAGFGLCYTVMLRWLPFLDAFDVGLLEHTLRLGKLPGFQRMTGHVPR